MKIICDGSDLADAVGKVSKALPVRTANPILEGIKLEAKQGSLVITATDLELSIERVIVADVKESGVTVVPGKFFSEFVRRLTNMRVELFAVENKLRIMYGTDGVSETACLDSNAYPDISRPENAQFFEMKRHDLKTLSNKISFAVGTDDARPVLKSISLQVVDGLVEGVALDGYRIAKCVMPVNSSADNFTLLVPARGFNEISRILDDSDDPIRLYVQRNFLMVELDGTTVITRLLDGSYINYRQIIPTAFESVVTMPKDAFSQAIARAELFASAERNYLVKFDIREDSLKITSEGGNGNFGETIPAHLDGVELTISFNAKYFSDIIRCIDGETVQLSLNTATTPCIITPTSRDDCLYLVLPVKNI